MADDLYWPWKAVSRDDAYAGRFPDNFDKLTTPEERFAMMDQLSLMKYGYPPDAKLEFRRDLIRVKRLHDPDDEDITE